MHSTPDPEPLDLFNKRLLDQVRPATWKNPVPPAQRYHLVVIGGGTAGLVTAAGAAGLGARVALVERHMLGGDCLNVGCVPSKAMLRSARAVADVRVATELGIRGAEGLNPDFAAIMQRMRELRAELGGHDSAERFRALGVDVYLGQAQFINPREIEVGGAVLPFKKAVIATGGRAARPEVAGIDEVPHLTNQTVFNLTALPARLAVIGGGPIGCELTQAFRRFGSDVTVVHRHGQLLGKEDPDAAAIVQGQFEKEGIKLLLRARLEGVRREGGAGGSIQVRGTQDGQPFHVEVDALLVAAGRQPNVEGLNLEAANVDFDLRAGVLVDDYLQTSNPHVLAAGDICQKWKFTHAADAAARIVIQNALFPIRKRVSGLVMPWCTYTDPEVAHVGLYEQEAEEAGMRTRQISQSMEGVDRAVLDGETNGFVKVLVQERSGRVLGATIVARHAGEMITALTVAIQKRMKLSELASVIHPYPTQAEAIRKAADAYNRSRLTPSTRRWLKRWFRWTG